ncbi:hypothetical protein F5876DRAFT_33480 [Lentinula aff. lateritia]|uniref:Uncharacterized protein n=1 Tax=Lentinula aff. lateritia TaxID=2804960 RepID=A0ACC1UAV3_9AGAR|nr:hypothetical protein F5876DRAFT_33480 [Lentinula aff. lateritia]
MSEGTVAAESSSRGRGRGRGKSRGGLGKYLRARGRGKGIGRPAEFSKRLVLEGEEGEEENEEETAARQAKYSRRNLGTNADRYAEQEPELDSDGEPIVEPEIDLSLFLEKQRLTDVHGPGTHLPPGDDDDVDHSLDNLTSSKTPNLKGKTQQIEWDDSLEDLLHEKAAAEATRELKNRFREKSEKLRISGRTTTTNSRKKGRKRPYTDAPPLPISGNERPKTEMEKMEDFLDDLLS